MDKFAHVVAASVLVAGLTACDGLYTSAPSGDGSVVVVNKWSGTVQRVQGDYISEVGPRPKKEPTSKLADPVFLPGVIPQQPVHILGFSEYRDGKMLVQVTVMPDVTPVNESAWKDWRAHIERARFIAGLSFQFYDARGFYPIEENLQLSSMKRVIDQQGALDSLQTQISVPTSEDTYRSITGWAVGWNGWPTYTGGGQPKK